MQKLSGHYKHSCLGIKGFDDMLTASVVALLGILYKLRKISGKIFLNFERSGKIEMV